MPYRWPLDAFRSAASKIGISSSMQLRRPFLLIEATFRPLLTFLIPQFRNVSALLNSSFFVLTSQSSIKRSISVFLAASNSS